MISTEWFPISSSHGAHDLKRNDEYFLFDSIDFRARIASCVVSITRNAVKWKSCAIQARLATLSFDSIRRKLANAACESWYWLHRNRRKMKFYSNDLANRNYNHLLKHVLRGPLQRLVRRRRCRVKRGMHLCMRECTVHAVTLSRCEMLRLLLAPLEVKSPLGS